jgi:hypothetical protein
MGLRTWLLCIIVAVTGCGDNLHPHDDGGPPADAAHDAPGSDGVVDAPSDAPGDGTIADAATDAPDDAATTDAPGDGSMADAPGDGSLADAPDDAPVDAMADAMTDAPADALMCTSGVTPMLCPPDGCTDLSVDPLHCGSCGNACTSGQTCQSGVCCGGGTTNCGGSCVNFQNDEQNCGGCGLACPSTDVCVNGGCQPNCQAPTPNLCNNACTNTQSDPNNCGTCGMQCGSGQVCMAGGCVPDCQAPTPNLCGATCTDLQTDEAHCGTCNTTCAAGQQCITGGCQCVAPTPDTCNGSCTNKQTDPNNCGGCGTVCGAGTVCNGGTCQLNCQNPTPDNCNGICTNNLADPNNCGTCGTTCNVGGFCINGGCTCPVSAPTVCNNTCVSLLQDDANCGACGTVCGGGTTCKNSVCCGAGLTGCNGACVDKANDPLNCGGCGITCSGGESCNNGTCSCSAGESLCNGQCIPTSVDPNNCGGCGITCPAGQACVSNGCSTTCPAPLTKCGNQCIDLKTDSAHCGSCSNAACTGNTGCDDGACVPVLPLGPPPAKCVGGGPPLILPTGGGTTCAGNLGSVFTYALCSRTDIGPLSQPVTTDAFDSTLGPYVPNMKGGSVGANGTISDTALLAIGGDLRVGGATGMAMKGDIAIRQRLYDEANLGITKLLSVNEDAYVGGPITAGGGGSGTITGTLTTPSCAGVPAALASAACVSAPVVVDPPCGTALDVIPVRQIVAYFEDPAHNDNATIGLVDTALANPAGSVRLDLPCGYYHLTSIGGSMPVTIVAHGHTGLFISGAVNSSKPFYLDLDPGATLDVFIGAVMVSAQAINVGSPAYPRLSRVYIGSPSCKGNGSCGTAADCCSGVCTAGSCQGTGGGLANSLKLSGGSTFLNGLFYAGLGEIRISNPLEMYGSLISNYYEASGPTIIHYDNAATQIGNECPPPTTCESCFDCNGQACNAKLCGACASDADCCQPLRCVNPGPGGTCKL